MPQTLAGPAGVYPPIVTGLSPTSALVQWTSPVQPNGQIEVYVVRWPEPRIEVREVELREMEVANLTGYTEYTVTVTACTGRYSVCLYVCLSVCLYVCLSVCLYVRLYCDL